MGGWVDSGVEGGVHDGVHGVVVMGWDGVGGVGSLGVVRMFLGCVYV